MTSRDKQTDWISWMCRLHDHYELKINCTVRLTVPAYFVPSGIICCQTTTSWRLRVNLNARFIWLFHILFFRTLMNISFRPERRVTRPWWTSGVRVSRSRLLLLSPLLWRYCTNTCAHLYTHVLFKLGIWANLAN